MRTIIIYTDGSCYPNPGVGGYGIIMKDLQTGKTLELKGGKNHTTSPEMELTAVIQALERLKYECNVVLYTDSEYVQKGITEWIETWRLGDWKKSIKHKHKWKRLYELNKRHKIEWNWVPGHAGVEGNERANDLAIEARKKKLTKMEISYAEELIE